MDSEHYCCWRPSTYYTASLNLKLKVLDFVKSGGPSRIGNYRAGSAVKTVTTPTPREAQVEDVGEPLSAFEMPMDGSDLDLAPTAMLQRKDGSTLFYDGKLNFLFGTPGSGKSWVALYAIQEALLRGKRAIYWDHEDTPSTLKRRSLLIGLDLADFWGEGQFKYLRPGLDGSTLAMAEAMTWIAGGDGPTLVVIDSAESAGCPSDGADVAPWLAKTVLPFRDAGASVLVLDHVPKRKEGRPLGPIGSQHKLARVDGAALYVSGVPWTPYPLRPQGPTRGSTRKPSVRLLRGW